MELVQVAQTLFAEEPRILRVESNVEADLWPRLGVDFTFVVEAHPWEIDRCLAHLVTRFMLEADVDAHFSVWEEEEAPKHRGRLVCSRENLNGRIEDRGSPGEGSNKLLAPQPGGGNV